MITYTKRLVGGSLFLFLMSLIAALIGYFTRIVLARNLTPAEYGLFYSIFAFVSFFLFFRGLGLNQALTKYIAEFRAKRQYSKIKTSIAAVFLWQLISSLFLGALLFIFSKYLGIYYFKDPSAALILKIFIIYILFSKAVQLIQSVFQGFQRIKLFSIEEPIRNTIMFLFVLLFFAFGIRVLTPVYAFTLSWAASFFIFFPILIKTYNPFRYKIEEFNAVSRKMFAFGVPVIFTTIAAKLIARIDTMMLTYFTTLDQVGIYNVVLPTAMLFLFFSESISTVSFPIISELWAKKDFTKLRDWIRMIYKYYFVAIIPVFLAVMFFSNLLIKLFFGIEYVSGAIALQILLFGMLFFTVARLNTNTISGIGHPMIVTKITIYIAFLNIFLNLILIPRFGINGAAFATTLSYLFILILSTKHTLKFIKTKLPFGAWIKTIFAGMLFVGVIYLLKNILIMNVWLELIISVAAASVVYLIAVLLLGLINVAEAKHYLKLLK